MLRVWVPIPTGGTDVCLLWVLWELSGRGLCDGLITRAEKSYWLCCVVVCDLETLINEEALAHWGGLSRQKQRNIFRVAFDLTALCWMFIALRWRALNVLKWRELVKSTCLNKRQSTEWCNFYLNKNTKRRTTGEGPWKFKRKSHVQSNCNVNISVSQSIGLNRRS